MNKIDMTGKTCWKHPKGIFQETGIQDDMHGVLHCTKGGEEIKRWQTHLMAIKLSDDVDFDEPWGYDEIDDD
jgi:hypothetical protein